MIKRRITISLMIVASLFFLIGSILFLPQFATYSTAGVWCFASGSFTMLVISIADLLEDLFTAS